MLLTFALFWMMQALVSVGYEWIEGRPPFTVNWVRLIPDTTPKPKPLKPPPLVRPKLAPPPPRIPSAPEALEPSTGVVPIVPFEDGDALEGVHESGGRDRGIVAMLRPDPDYPASAEARGISGWVQLEFTVTETGLVRDARVVSSRPAQVFDGAALTAIARWRYRPQILNGRAVDTPGVRVVLEFRP
jgi:protein TonB